LEFKLTETNTPDAYEVLLEKIAGMIKAQAGGEVLPFTAENLNHVYLNLVDGAVDQQASDLLDKIVGPNWTEGLNPGNEQDEAISEAKNMALVELIQQIDERNPQDAVASLASALMVACRELGWLEASRAAHDQWFYADDTA
jgi:hypothetical protein